MAYDYWSSLAKMLGGVIGEENSYMNRTIIIRQT